MSVIVKGMQMPENCWECTGVGLNVGVSVFGGICPFCEKIRTDHDMKTGRHPECPLGAMPDKHGRLVDADELIKFVEDRYEITWESDCYEGGIKDACSDILEKIDTMPTIVEAEGEE